MTKKICTLALSSPFDPDLYTKAVTQAEKSGFQIISHAKPFEHTPRFINGSVIFRLHSCTQALSMHPDAIWCTRGGTGALELWPEILDHDITNSDIPLIGYSDSTIILLARWLRSRETSIHGPVFIDLAKNKNIFLELIFRLLDNNTNNNITYPKLKLRNNIILKNNSGILICMNLTSLQSLCGIIPNNIFNKIFLFLEDTNEPDYKIFRKLTQLKLSGILDNLRGLIIGQFGPDREKLFAEIFCKFATELDTPVFDWPVFGHEQENWPLKFGAQIKLQHEQNNLYNLRYT